MRQTIRWGIVGTGNIAKTFARGLSVLPDAELVAVGSRSQESADAFAEKYGIPHRHTGYRELANDDSVDAVYIATPHPFHKDNSILCLNAGKAVLCEKPITISARQTRELVTVARKEKRFLMEAMWTRFLPITLKVREWLKSGAIGRPRMLIGDFGFRTGVNEEGRLFNRTLAGGALLDVGIYTVSYASMVFGRQPKDIAGLADLGQTGVDEQSAMVLRYDDGALALLACAIRTNTPHAMCIMGETGLIRLEPPFWRGTTATLVAGGKEERIELPYEGNGYNCEAAEVMRCIRDGKLESETMPLDESVAIMKTLDAIRSQYGLSYPME